MEREISVAPVRPTEVVPTETDLSIWFPSEALLFLDKLMATDSGMLDFARESKQSPATWKSLQEKSWLFYKQCTSLQVLKVQYMYTVCLIL